MKLYNLILKAIYAHILHFTSLCLDTVSARMGVDHLLLSAQLPGTHWVMICVIRHLSLTVSDELLKTRLFSEY